MEGYGIFNNDLKMKGNPNVFGLEINGELHLIIPRTYPEPSGLLLLGRLTNKFVFEKVTDSTNNQIIDMISEMKLGPWSKYNVYKHETLNVDMK